MERKVYVFSPMIFFKEICRLFCDGSIPIYVFGLICFVFLLKMDLCY